MDNSKSSSGNLQDTITTNFQNLANTSMNAYRPILDAMISGVGAMTKMVQSGTYGNLKIPMLNTGSSDCCPPKRECPPHCIASIYRCAMPQERIIVPFQVKNNCSTTKTYQVGVRDLLDQDGNPAPAQPVLNKQTVTLDPGRTERVLMMVDLAQFKLGSTYTAEIVLREKNINQNICFTLEVKDDNPVVTAEPRDEQKIQMHWQSWQSHYYCEPQKKIVIGSTMDPVTQVPPASAKK